MLTKLFRSSTSKVILPLLSVLLFIYILFFEFILTSNSILPKPTILLDTIPALFQDYDFLSSFLFSFTAIYSVIIISYFLIRIGSYWLYSIVQYLPGVRELFIISKYFIPLFLILLFELWFGNSIWGEYLFILLIFMGILKSSIVSELENVKNEFILSAKSLGLSENEIFTKVIWKSIQPNVYKSILDFHIPIWSFTIIYEFICRTDGVGNVFYLALKYNDLSLAIVIFIFMIIIFLIMEIILKSIKKKYFFWEL